MEDQTDVDNVYVEEQDGVARRHLDQRWQRALRPYGQQERRGRVVVTVFTIVLLLILVPLALRLADSDPLAIIRGATRVDYGAGFGAL